MKHRIVIGVSLLTAAVVLLPAPVQADEAKSRGEKSAAATKVYGEWFIRPRPDKGSTTA
jgi:hypothetical protein